MKVIPPLTLASTGTFTRSTTATYFDAAGVLQTAAVNTPRFDHDPVTLVPLGLMAENATTNFLAYASTPNVWGTFTESGSNGTVSVISDPKFGNVVRLTKTAGASSARFGVNVSVASGLSGSNFAISVWAKSNLAGTAATPAYMDASRVGGGLVSTNVVMTAAVGTWQKYKGAASGPLLGGGQFYALISGPVNSSIDFVLPQLELGAVASSFMVNTTAGAITRAADVLSGAYSNVPEPDTGETPWNAATAYTVRVKAIRTTTHRVYERLIAGTTATAPESDPINWADAGPTNRTAMLDLYRNTKTAETGGINFALAPGQRVDALALMGLEADSVTVAMWANGVEVYRHTELLNTRTVLNWYDYFFAPFSRKESVALFDLPPYSNGVLSVVLAGTGEVKCGALCLGSATDIGRVQYGATRGFLNFSKVDRDVFGNATLVPRRDVPTTNQTTWLPKAQANRVLVLLESLGGVPCVWSGLDDDNGDGYFDALLILGVRKDCRISLDYPEDAKLDLTLEEI